MDEQNSKEIPMIPKHQHQAEMMHMSRAVKIICIVSVSAFIAMVVMAYVFVTGYTSRTRDILNTINNLRVYTVEEKIDGQKAP